MLTLENLTTDIQETVNSWLNGPYDQTTKETIHQLLKENPSEIINSFYTKLHFGTGGLRALMGVGPNRMNIYSIMTATQGLANYIHEYPSPSTLHAVLIGYDSRHNSQLFAETAAKVLAANNIKVYLFSALRPTPLISFGCRLKKCTAAIMITASHNPATYNGYKVYWNDGGQIVSPHDKGIMQSFYSITDINMVERAENLQHPLIEMISNELDNAYLEMITKLQHYKTDNQQHGNQVKIVYTSLHGTGITLMPQALASWGFHNISLVDQQCIPDGSFPTVSSPNPEEPKALSMGIKILLDSNSDVLIATDPDADRLGVVVRHKNKPYILNGNQIACLCLEHICRASASFSNKTAVIKTIATTELFQAIANRYQLNCFNVLPGFKYIGSKIHEWEHDSQRFQFLFGAEESFGYLLGQEVRDKDGIVSGALIAEITLQAKLQNKTLIDLLYDLYSIYGVYHEEICSIQFEESKSGKEQMIQSMNKLRTTPPKSIRDMLVVALEDYQLSTCIDLITKTTTQLTLPKSETLVFWLQDQTKIIIRPSGTEPKIKIYIGLVSHQLKNIEEAINESQERSRNILLFLKNHLCKEGSYE